MNIKQIIIISLILVFLSLTAVSAADTNNTHVTESSHIDDSLVSNDYNFKNVNVAQSDNISEKLNNDVKETVNENEYTLSQLEMTVKWMKNEVKLNADYRYNPNFDKCKPIEISKSDIIIDGQGHTIDAAGKTKIFSFTGANIVLKNINFENGYTQNSVSDYELNYGGAVYFKNGGTIENCNFINNHAENGGAVCSHGNLKIEKCIFNDNYASIIGGAVFNDNNININDCIFKDNHAGTEAGALYLKEGYIINSIFENNAVKTKTSVSIGGAIHIEHDGLICNCDFKNNSARYGGAIFVSENAYILDCNFNGNSAIAEGGAVFAGNNLKIENSTMKDNVASKNNNIGGRHEELIELINVIILPHNTDLIENSTMKYNVTSENDNNPEGIVKAYIGVRSLGKLIKDGKVSLTILGLKPEKYSENVIYESNSAYKSQSQPITFNLTSETAVLPSYWEI